MELFKLFGTIAVNNNEANKAIDETTNKAESSGSKLGSAVSKIGGAAMKIGAAAATVIGAGATALGALAKKSLDAYANNEQLIGGIETLFGAGGQSLEEYAAAVGKSVDAAKKEYDALLSAQDYMVKRADEAFRTAGLSSNEYMETVTSFSASLIASVGGDTVKAGKLADQAIIDMSDNANKMGSSMESIQNAYQGFAKQNYTMLDNLKLGYGGTKEEMQRLLADAEKLTGKKFDLSSFADVTEAIHAIQSEMGITGTTAKEASATISGSVGAMKAAWQNFLTSMAKGDEAFQTSIGNLVDTVVTAANNIIPKLVDIFPKVVEGLMQIVEQLIPQIQPMLDKLLPPLLEGAVKLIVYLIKELPSLLASLGKALLSALQSLFNEIGAVLPDSVLKSFSSIAEGFKRVLEGIKAVFAPVIETIRATIAANLPKWKESFDHFKDSLSALQPVVELVGAAIAWLLAAFSGAVNGLISAFSGIMDVLSGVIQIVGGFFDVLIGIFTGNFDQIKKGWDNMGLGIIDVFAGLWDAVSGFIKGFVDGVVSFFQGLFDVLVGHSIVPDMGDAIVDVFAGLWDRIKGFVKGFVDGVVKFFTDLKNKAVEIFNSMKTFVSNIFTSIKTAISNTLTSAKNVVSTIFNAIRSTVSSVGTSIRNTASTLFNGVRDAISRPIEAAKTLVQNGLNAIKGFFDRLTLKFPKIKLPHFSVNGSLSLNPPSVPRISVDWYKSGGIMTKPTAFGINPTTGALRVGGEAGDEAVAPIDTLLGYVKSAVQEENSTLTYTLQRLIDMLADYFPQIIEGLDKAIVLDDGTLVGKITPQINRRLGDIQTANGRGR